MILDTNVLLNGIFNPKSFSYKILHSYGSSQKLYLVENSIDEAEKAMSRAYAKTGINLKNRFYHSIKVLKIVSLPRITRTQAREMKRVKGSEDKAIAYASAHYKIPICTCDVSDFRDSKKYGFEIFTPENAISEELNMDNILTGYLANNQKGTIFIQFSPQWSGRKLSTLGNMKFYLFDIPGFMSCFFDSETSSLNTILLENNSTSITIQEELNNELKVVITYDNEIGLNLYFGYRGKQSSIEHKWNSDIKLDSNSKIHIGSDSKNQNSIFSNLRYFCSLPDFLSETGINNLMNNKTLPLPWDRLPLETVINTFYM